MTIKPVAFSEINTDEFRRNSEIDLIARIKAYITEFCVKAADEVPACAKGSCITQGQAHTA